MKKIWNKYNWAGRILIVIPSFAMATCCYLTEKAGNYLMNKLVNVFVKE